MWGRIKLRRADTLFSLYLRKNAATDVNLTMHSFLKAEGLPFPIFGAEARIPFASMKRIATSFASHTMLILKSTKPNMKLGKKTAWERKHSTS